MVQIEKYENCDSNCEGNKQHESYLNNTYDDPEIFWSMKTGFAYF